MSGPQDIGIRQRARGGLSGRTTPAHSPTNDLDDEHLAAHRGVRDTCTCYIPYSLTWSRIAEG